MVCYIITPAIPPSEPATDINGAEAEQTIRWSSPTTPRVKPTLRPCCRRRCVLPIHHTDGARATCRIGHLRRLLALRRCFLLPSKQTRKIGGAHHENKRLRWRAPPGAPGSVSGTGSSKQCSEPASTLIVPSSEFPYRESNIAPGQCIPRLWLHHPLLAQRQACESKVANVTEPQRDEIAPDHLDLGSCRKDCQSDKAHEKIHVA